MDFDLVDKVAALALERVKRGVSLTDTVSGISQMILPSLPDSVRDLLSQSDIEIDAEALCEQLRMTLRDEPPDIDICGLYFGLAEMSFSQDPEGADEPIEVTLYVCGSTRFDPADSDWCCNPEWWPETRYFSIPLFKALSDHAAELDPDTSWMVSAGLIEPISIALVAEACRRIEPETLLGQAPFRGIGSGFDSGDLRDVGVVTKEGFVSPALLEPMGEADEAMSSEERALQPKPAAGRGKATKGSASKTKRSTSKPTPKKSAKKTTRKASQKAAKKTSKKPVKKSAAKKVAKKKGSKKATSRKATQGPFKKTGKKAVSKRVKRRPEASSRASKKAPARKGASKAAPRMAKKRASGR